VGSKSLRQLTRRDESKVATLRVWACSRCSINVTSSYDGLSVFLSGFSLSLFSFFFSVLGFELRALGLLGRCSATPALFALVTFLNRVCVHVRAGLAHDPK
jgi:hypothetical protein